MQDIKIVPEITFSARITFKIKIGIEIRKYIPINIPSPISKYEKDNVFPYLSRVVESPINKGTHITNAIYAAKTPAKVKSCTLK